MPPAVRSQFRASVLANQPLCREHYRLVLGVNGFPPTIPGQFIQISCRGVENDDRLVAQFDWQPGQQAQMTDVELLAPVAVLRRPFSLAGRSDEGRQTRLEVIQRVVGVGTEWMADLELGDAVDILGPLGNHFELPPPGQPAILVGGGVGIPPMLYLAGALAGRSGSVAFCGATSDDLLPLNLTAPAHPTEPRMCVKEFADAGIPTILSTDDGSVGFRGFVTQALEAYLDRNTAAKPVIYTCGPELMMKRVAQIAIERGLECQVAVERAMACGMGTCQSCCIRVRATGRRDGRKWIYRLACTDGPIFRAADLLW